MNHRIQNALTLFGAISLLPYQAFAIDIPETTSPSRIQDRIQIEQNRPELGGQTLVTIPADNGLSRVVKDNVTFKLVGVTVDGAFALDAGRVSQTYNDLLGSDIDLQKLKSIAYEITKTYREAGYVLTLAVIPPQRINNGVVRIRIVEGHVNDVIFEGIAEVSDQLKSYAEKIRTEKPLKAETLEKYLLRMQDLAGIQVTSLIRPSKTEVGAADVIIKVVQKKVEASISIDNRGTRYIGPFEAGLVTSFNNLLGVHDRTQVKLFSASNPDELRYGQISHEEIIGDEGTTLRFSASRTRTNPGFKLKDFEIEGSDTTYNVSVKHPIIRSRSENLYGEIKTEIRNSNTDSLSEPLFRDRIRVLRGSTSYDFVDGFSGINQIDTEISKGFDLWRSKSSVGFSRVDADMNFWKFTARMSRTQYIDSSFGLRLSSAGQQSSQLLLPAEQFGLGGAEFGSAYDPSELLGDSGIAGRIEIFHDSGQIAKEFDSNVQPYTFYDVGTVWKNDAISQDSRSLASAGLGFRIFGHENVSGSLELALPLTRKVSAMGEDGASPRLFFSLNIRN